MNAHSENGGPHIIGTGLVFGVWASLLILTGIEVFLAYERIALNLMLALLMVISLMKAALIVAYFMHLRFEKKSLVLSLIPALVVVASTLVVFFPDSLRLLNMRPW